MTKQDHVRLLEKKNTVLKIENEALKEKLLKKYVYLICNKLYNRSDDLYTHF